MRAMSLVAHVSSSSIQFGERSMLRYAVVGLVAIPGVTCLVVLLAGAFGYLAYSDRPGLGWYGLGWRGISLRELQFIGAFGLLMLPFSAIAVALHIGVGWLLRIMRLPRPTVHVCAGISGGLLASLISMSAGWYIALGSVGMLASGVTGLVWGLFLPVGTRQASSASAHTPLAAFLSILHSLALVPVGLLPLLLVLVGLFDLREPVITDLPADYRGWVIMRYERPECPEMAREGVSLVVSVPSSGCVCTSSPEPKHLRAYIYRAAQSDGTRQGMSNAMIHLQGPGSGVGQFPRYDPAGKWLGSGPREVRETYFVGTDDEFREPGNRKDVRDLYLQCPLDDEAMQTGSTVKGRMSWI